MITIVWSREDRICIRSVTKADIDLDDLDDLDKSVLIHIPEESEVIDESSNGWESIQIFIGSTMVKKIIF